jgi:hypothetical protein
MLYKQNILEHSDNIVWMISKITVTKSQYLLVQTQTASTLLIKLRWLHNFCSHMKAFSKTLHGTLYHKTYLTRYCCATLYFSEHYDTLHLTKHCFRALHLTTHCYRALYLTTHCNRALHLTKHCYSALYLTQHRYRAL